MIHSYFLQENASVGSILSNRTLNNTREYLTDNLAENIYYFIEAIIYTVP